MEFPEVLLKKNVNSLVHKTWNQMLDCKLIVTGRQFDEIYAQEECAVAINLKLVYLCVKVA